MHFLKKKIKKNNLNRVVKFENHNFDPGSGPRIVHWGHLLRKLQGLIKDEKQTAKAVVGNIFPYAVIYIFLKKIPNSIQFSQSECFSSVTRMFRNCSMRRTNMRRSSDPASMLYYHQINLMNNILSLFVLLHTGHS